MSTVEGMMCSFMCSGPICVCDLLLLLSVLPCRGINSVLLHKGLFLMLYPRRDDVQDLLMDFRSPLKVHGFV